MEANLNWRKSSYSSGSGAECVEVGQSPGAIAVRDTQDRHGRTLAFTTNAWRKFADQIKHSLSRDLIWGPLVVSRPIGHGQTACTTPSSLAQRWNAGRTAVEQPGFRS
jgi:hypothetical protein